MVAFSPGATCCCGCPPMEDHCTSCGREAEEAARYEVILEGIGVCDPPTLQSCADCDVYNGTYMTAWATFDDDSPIGAYRRCVYRYVLPTETCNQRIPSQMAISTVELYITYIGDPTGNLCRTNVEVFVRAYELPATLKAAFLHSRPGLISCTAIDNLILEPHPLYLPCSGNVVCEFAGATARVTFVPPEPSLPILTEEGEPMLTEDGFALET